MQAIVQQRMYNDAYIDEGTRCIKYWTGIETPKYWLKVC